MALTPPIYTVSHASPRSSGAIGDTGRRGSQMVRLVHLAAGITEYDILYFLTLDSFFSFYL